MNESEFRVYALTGELRAEVWESLMLLMGRLGLSVVSIVPGDEASGADNATPTDESADSSERRMEEGLPYSVSEITSPLQFLSNEHIGQFWPVYRQSVLNANGTGGRKPDKAQAIMWGVNMLAYPSERGRRDREASRRVEIREALGLVVESRVSAGFPSELQGRRYGLWNHEDYPGAVIQVGSFIDAVRTISDTPSRRRPFGIDAPEVKFFLALADSLEAQILAATNQEAS